MDAEHLLPLLRFHAWSNHRIMTTAAELTDDQLRAPDTMDLGSAFDVLRHLVDVDWSWREYLDGTDVGDGYLWDTVDGLDDLAGLRAYSTGEDARFRKHVEGLDATAANESLTLDDEHSVPRWLLVTHIVNHGTQHRSELARYFTVCGHSPGEMDMLDHMELPWPDGV